VIELHTAYMIGAFCVVMQAFFSGSEIAMISASRSRLRAKAAAGDRGARLAEKFLARPQVMLATTLMGTNIALITFSVVIALALIGRTHSELLSIALVSPVTLILGEVIPKSLFQQNADFLATKVVYPLRLASIIMRPAIWLLSEFAGLVAGLFGADKARTFVTRDELAMLIDVEAGGSAEISDDERDMIVNVLELSSATATEVMMPLSEVTALAEDTTVGEAALEVADKQHSRMPVYRERVDNIIGILHVFDLLQAGPQAKSRIVAEVARPAMYVPENKPAAELLVELQRSGHHLAVVVDEYGGAVGIVTVEDILEEVVGDIEDEYDVKPSPIRVERPGVWRLEARTSVERVNKELKLGLPLSDEYETVAGLVLEHLKRIPAPGEALTVGNATIRIIAASDRAVEEVQITRKRK
jgi:putative hemolysin